MFPVDFLEELVELGVNREVALGLYMSDAIHKKMCILALYQDYGLEKNEYKDAIDTYLNYMLEKWNSYEVKDNES